MARQWVRLLLLAMVVSSAAHAQDGGKTSSTGRDDAAIYRRIELVRRAAAGFRLDGSDRDWRQVPQISAARNAADDSRDIVAVGVAPRENDLCIMLRTAGLPSTDNWVFYLEIDLLGSHADDFRIELESLRRVPALRLYDDNQQPGRPVPLRNARVAIRRVVEMRIPYRDIAAALPQDKASLVKGNKARPWVRVRSWTWDAQRQRKVDFGPAVASYRLIETPYPLDPPLPTRPQPPVAVGLPLHGQWFVSQGAMGSYSHRNVWAYDLVKLDPSGFQSSPRGSKENADYYAWGQPIFSSVHGRVLRARSTMEDSPAWQPNLRGSVANQVYIAASNGFGLDLVHLRKDSARVAAFDRVSPGQQVGVIGNSGRSDIPHLHMAIWTGRFSRRTVPLAWTNVRVGLNPGPDDPWTRELPRWEPRAGLFVEPMESMPFAADAGDKRPGKNPG